MVEQHPEDPTLLNEKCWEVVSRPGASESAYRTAVRWAETACRIAPKDGSYLNTLGVAQYRLGRYNDALATLTRSNALNGGRDPWDLAFLAMAQHRLGRTEEVRRTLSELRDVMKTPPPGCAAESSESLLREVEAVIDFDPGFPADPFAP